MNMDVTSILRVCGIGSYIHIGDGQSTLVFELLTRSIDAYGIDSSQTIVAKNLERAPERFFQGSLTDFPFTAKNFDTVIIGSELLSYEENDLVQLFKTLYQITKRNLVIYFPSNVIKAVLHQRPAGRVFWERIAFEAGFRRHLRSMMMTGYDQLENEELETLSFFECVPETALQLFPNATIPPHTDMLRQTSRNADASLARYLLASSRLRSGTVLDIGCGLGYGTAALAACHNNLHCIGVDTDVHAIAYAEANYAVTDKSLSYRTSSLTSLSFLPNHSVDTVIAFDVIAKMHNYEDFLNEIYRVLKPDGCFWGSVQNLWNDDTDTTNHVFDWTKLSNAISKHFIIDGRWAQSAGGGFKIGRGRRDLKKIPLDHSVPLDAEWWIFSANVDPRHAKQYPYVNPYYKDEIKVPNHVRFDQFYDNPWIYRLIVHQYERVMDANILSKFCAEIAKESNPGSADHGAALYVIAHKLLESGHVTINAVNILLTHIHTFDQAYNRKNPHAHRWSISLRYVTGRLFLALGNRDEALTTLMSCAEMEPTTVNPALIATMISARLHAGLIHVGSGSFEKAREQFILGIKKAHTILQGDWHNIIGEFEKPIPHGLPEAIEVLNAASQCAEALNALERQSCAPGFFWDRINFLPA